MGKNNKAVFSHQLKTLEDIEQKIRALIVEHRKLSGSHLGVVFRTVIDPNSATLYKQGHHGNGGINQGIRECDFKLSKSDPNWVLASSKHGLSFSSSVNHATKITKFLGGFQKTGTKINCAYWILENNDAIPPDMEFVQDPDDSDHYLLTITKDMKITDLVFKLTWISQRMTVMTDLTLEVNKNA